MEFDDGFCGSDDAKTETYIVLSFVFARGADTIARTQRKDKKHSENDNLKMEKEFLGRFSEFEGRQKLEKMMICFLLKLLMKGPH